MQTCHIISESGRINPDTSDLKSWSTFAQEGLGCKSCCAQSLGSRNCGAYVLSRFPPQALFKHHQGILQGRAVIFFSVVFTGMSACQER